MTFARALLVGALYVVAGKLGLLLAAPDAGAMPVWPPTGIAIAALLLFGRRMWPAVFAGALVVSAVTSGFSLAAVAIAAGNTLESVLATDVITRFARGRRFPERAYDVIKFTVLAGLLATAVCATIGVT